MIYPSARSFVFRTSLSPSTILINLLPFSPFSHALLIMITSQSIVLVYAMNIRRHYTYTYPSYVLIMSAYLDSQFIGASDICPSEDDVHFLVRSIQCRFSSSLSRSLVCFVNGQRRIALALLLHREDQSSRSIRPTCVAEMPAKSQLEFGKEVRPEKLVPSEAAKRYRRSIEPRVCQCTYLRALRTLVIIYSSICIVRDYW